jgi:hypothetical protein
MQASRPPPWPGSSATVATPLQFYVRSIDDSVARAAVRFGAVLAAAAGS